MTEKSTKMPKLLPFLYLPNDKITSVFKNNKEFVLSFKENYLKLHEKYVKFYNKNSRQKLNDINSLIIGSREEFVERENDSYKEIIDKLTYRLSYGQVMNELLESNRIIVFRFKIENTLSSSFSFKQLMALVMALRFPREIVLFVEDRSLISENEFGAIVEEILKKENIASMTTYFGKNYFFANRKTKKFGTFVKESNKDNSSFIRFRNIAYDKYNKTLELEYITLNIEDYDYSLKSNEKVEDFKPRKKTLELSFSLDDEEKIEKFLADFSCSVRMFVNKGDNLTLKILIFKLPLSFSYLKIADLITELTPSKLILVPYKDVDPKFADDFLEKINEKCDFSLFNTVNLVGFSSEKLRKFVEKQRNLEELRICGNMGEGEMKTVLERYCELLSSPSPTYSLRSLSLNGPIRMSRSWSDTIIRFLSLPQIRSFHVDCFFNGVEFMKEIAEAFIKNQNCESFAVRNTTRGPKDEFVSVLKEILYEKGVPKKDAFVKIRKYKLI